MSDFTVSMSQLQSHSNDVEKYRVWEKLRQQALLRFETNGSGTSDGAGSWLILWQGTVPTDTKWTVNAEITGSGTTGSAVYYLSVGIQNIAGVLTPVAVTAQLTFVREDQAAMDCNFDITGTVFSIQVRDDGTVPMKWKVFIDAVGTV